MKKVFGKKVYFAKMNEKAVIPSKKNEDAGYDIYACFDEDYIRNKTYANRHCLGL